MNNKLFDTISEIKISLPFSDIWFPLLILKLYLSLCAMTFVMWHINQLFRYVYFWVCAHAKECCNGYQQVAIKTNQFTAAIPPSDDGQNRLSCTIVLGKSFGAKVVLQRLL